MKCAFAITYFPLARSSMFCMLNRHPSDLRFAKRERNELTMNSHLSDKNNGNERTNEKQPFCRWQTDILMFIYSERIKLYSGMYLSSSHVIFYHSRQVNFEICFYVWKQHYFLFFSKWEKHRDIFAPGDYRVEFVQRICSFKTSVK